MQLLTLPFIALLFAFSPLLSWAGGPGTTGFNSLKLNVGARQVGMGEAATAVADDVNAASWNPSAWGELNRQEASFVHTSYVQSIFYEYLAYAHPVLKSGTLGGQVHYFNFGNIQGYDNSGAKASAFGAYDLTAALGYGKTLGRDFVAGVNLKYLSETILDTTGRTFATDLGMLYRPESRGDWLSHWRLGLAVRNLGPDAKFISRSESLPRSVDMGVAYRAMANTLALALDIHKPGDNNASVNLGGEFWLFNTLAVRMGYRNAADIGNGLTFGMGLKFKMIQADFAFVDYGDFGSSQQMGLIYRFGGIGENLYQEAVKEQQEGHYAEAILKYLKVLDVNPDHRGALQGLKEATRLLRKERGESE